MHTLTERSGCISVAHVKVYVLHHDGLAWNGVTTSKSYCFSCCRSAADVSVCDVVNLHSWGLYSRQQRGNSELVCTEDPTNLGNTNANSVLIWTDDPTNLGNTNA